jgi:hypothetical protein
MKRIDCWQVVNGKKIMFDESGKRIELTEDDIKNGKLEEIKVDGQKYYLHEEKGRHFYYKDGEKIDYVCKVFSKKDGFNDKLKYITKKNMQKALLLPANEFNQRLLNNAKADLQMDLFKEDEANQAFKAVAKTTKKVVNIILKLTGLDIYVKIGIGIMLFYF